MKLESLHDLFVAELRDIYSAENQILKALPKMAKAASAPELRDAFKKHLKQTEQQVARLEKIFKQLDVGPRGKKCKAMEGLIEEGAEVMKQEGEPAVLDAALIAGAQKIEHYEMAGYGCVRTWARLLGHEDAADLLQETLDEEGETNKKLTALADNGTNAEAAELAAVGRS